MEPNLKGQVYKNMKCPGGYYVSMLSTMEMDCCRRVAFKWVAFDAGGITS